MLAYFDGQPSHFGDERSRHGGCAVFSSARLRTGDTRVMDGIELAVLKSRFERIVSSMVNTVTRTGRSGVLNTARDCSCCILTKDDEFLIMADSQPIHVMS